MSEYDEGSEDMLVQVGEKVEDFEAEVFHQNTIKKVKLSELQGKWVVLLFYPADFTFICPTELSEAADLYGQFQGLGAEVMSVSTDTTFVHKAWKDNSPAIQKINYPMIADPTGKICRQFGTYIDNEGLSLRGTFIIDPDGILKAAEIHDNSIGRSAQEVLRKLQAAVHVRQNPGHVCPAGWEPGKETLQPSLDLVGKI